MAYRTITIFTNSKGGIGYSVQQKDRPNNGDQLVEMCVYSDEYSLRQRIDGYGAPNASTEIIDNRAA